MVSYDIKELQRHLLGILLAFDRLCHEHGLTYYLCAGTMLGAVRHQGFIPWDDDADVMMPRKDYDTLVAHADEWIGQPLELVCFEKDHGVPSTIAKLIDSSTTLIERAHVNALGGIYIDIFPLDGTSDCKLINHLHISTIIAIKQLSYHRNRDPYKHGHGPDAWLHKLLQRLYSNERLQRAIIRLQRKYPYESATFVSDFDDGPRTLLRRDFLGKPTPICFEGHLLMGVERPHDYLTAHYGDYMALPPEGKRKQHGFHYLNYELPYREYTDTRTF